MPTKEEEKKKLEDSRGQQRTVEDAAPELTFDEIVATGANAEGTTDAARASVPQVPKPEALPEQKSTETQKNEVVKPATLQERADARAAAARAAAKPGRLTASVPVPKPVTLPKREVKPAESPYDWWFKAQAAREAEDEARYAEQEARLKRRKLFDTLGHGFGAFHEAYARARGETPMVEASKYGGKWQAQWDKLQEDRAKNRTAHMNARVSMLEAQQRSEDKNALRILRENATNERLKKYQSEIDLLLLRGKTEEAKAKKAEADALVAKARADKLNIDNQYLPRLHEATISEKQSRAAKNIANTAYTAARTAAKNAKDNAKPGEKSATASPSTGQAGKTAANGSGKTASVAGGKTAPSRRKQAINNNNTPPYRRK